LMLQQKNSESEAIQFMKKEMKMQTEFINELQMKIDEIGSDKNDLESQKTLLEKKLQFAYEKIKLLESELENSKNNPAINVQSHLAESVTILLEQKVHRLEKENEILKQ